MKILYTGDILSGTGYSVAAKNTILSLATTDIDIAVRNMRLAPQYNDPGPIIKSLMKKDIDNVDVVIQHILAPYFTYKQGMKNIGYFHWETDNLEPSGWQYYCQLMDEIWVSCDENLETVKKCLPNKPVKKVHIGLDPTLFDKTKYEPLMKDFRYKFYHIGDYSSRKNVYNLIKCYLEEFSCYDNVVLMLKCYVEGCSGAESAQIINNDIMQLKQTLRKGNLESYPSIILITDYLTEEQILALHATGDCFVSLERGAAWNLPAFYARAMGNQIVVNGWGGQNEFLDKDNSFGCYKTQYEMIPCNGMDRCPYKNLYSCYEAWAEPNMKEIKTYMRNAFYNRNSGSVKDLIDIRQKSFLEQFSYQSIGKQIKKVLES